MKENWLKDKLYDRLGNKENQADLDQLWNELEAKRFPGKKRRALWLWLIPVLLVLFALVFFVQNSQTHHEVSESTLNSENIAEEKNKSLQEKEIIVDRNESLVEPNSQLSTPQQETALNSFATPIKENRNNFSNYSNANKLTKSKKATDTTKADIAVSSESMETAETINMSDDTATASLSQQTETGNQKIVISTNRQALILGSINYLDITLSLIESPERIWDRIPNVAEWHPDNYNRRSEEKNNLISLSGSYGLMSSDLASVQVDTFGQLTEDYINQRNDIEEALDYWDLAFSYRRMLSDKFSLQAGLSYQQYTSRYRLTQTDITTETIIDTTEVYFTGGEITDITLGEIPVTTTSISRTTNYIKYRLVRIPVLLAYELKFNDQFSLSLASGVSFGIGSIGESRLINPDLTNFEFAGLEETGYKHSTQLESLTQLSINRSFSNDWVATVGLKYNRDLSNRLNNSTQAEHHLSSFNFNIGLGKRF